MTSATDTQPESRAFEADVSRLLHLMVHSVYSDKDVFLRELISNAADACERLRYEAIATPALLGDDAKPRITITLDAEARTLTVEDNGIGMSRDELVEALGTIARSGTKAFMERLEASKTTDRRDAHRPVRHRLLFRLHGRRPRRGHLAPRRHRRGVALVVGRQGHVHGRRRGARRGAGARHAGRAAPDGGRQGLHRAVPDRAHRQGQLRPCAGADRDRRKARRRAGRAGRRRGAVDQAAQRDQAGGIHRLLPQRRRPVRRAGADRAFPRRGPARIHRAAPSCRARGRSISSIPSARGA